MLKSGIGIGDGIALEENQDGINCLGNIYQVVVSLGRSGRKV